MNSRSKKTTFFLMLVLMLTIFCVIGCGRIQKEQDERKASEDTITPENVGTENAVTSEDTDTAADAQIDFDSLKGKNSDIFAWIQIPDTKIDYPVLQSEEADDFYESHNADKEADHSGAIYIELANLTSMCDFNTVLHGKTGADNTGLFADLYRFANPDFFEKHENIYLYLDGNVLTYEVFAAYERENTSLIRSYDFTYLSGCQQFLDDLYNTRDMSMNLREGWEEVSPYHFLITLTTQKEESTDKQFIVVAALIDDAAGTINRVVTE